MYVAPSACVELGAGNGSISGQFCDAATNTYKMTWHSVAGCAGLGMPTLQPADGACVMQAPGSYASTVCDFANPIVFATIRYTAYASADCSGAGNAGSGTVTTTEASARCTADTSGGGVAFADFCEGTTYTARADHTPRAPTMAVCIAYSL